LRGQERGGEVDGYGGLVAAVEELATSESVLEGLGYAVAIVSVGAGQDGHFGFVAWVAAGGAIGLIYLCGFVGFIFLELGLPCFLFTLTMGSFVFADFLLSGFGGVKVPLCWG
jgi:hypothetical protein